MRRKNGSLNGERFFLLALFPFPQFHLASVFVQSSAPNVISWRAFDGAESRFEDVYPLCRTRLMMFSSAQLILQSSEMCQMEPLARRVTGLCRHTFIGSQLVCFICDLFDAPAQRPTCFYKRPLGRNSKAISKLAK